MPDEKFQSPNEALKEFMNTPLPGETTAPPVNAGQDIEKLAKPPEKPAEKPAGTPPDEKPPEKPATETPPKADEKPDETKVPRSSKDWEAFKTKVYGERDAAAKERDTLKTTLADADKRLKELEARPQHPDYEDLKKERDALDQQLRMFNVERHPKFKGYYDGKLKAQLEIAKGLVGPELAGEVEKLLLAPDSEYKTARLDEIMSELTYSRSGRLAATVNAVSEVQAEREAEIAKSRENYEKMVLERDQQAKQQQESLERLVDETLKSIEQAADSPPPLRKREGDNKWNDELDERTRLARQIALGGTKDPRDMVRIVASGLALPRAISDVKAASARIAELEKEIEGLKAAQPSLPAGEPGEAPKGKSIPSGPMSPKELRDFVGGIIAEESRG